MCEPTSLLTAALTAAQTARPLIGAVSRDADARARARQAEVAARNARSDGAAAEERTRRRARARLGRLANRQSASGTRASQGSNLDAAAALAEDLEAESLATRTRFERQAGQLTDQAGRLRAQGRAGLVQAGLGAATNLLSRGQGAVSEGGASPFSVPRV